MLLTGTAAYPRAPSPRGGTTAWHSCRFTPKTIRLFSHQPVIEGESVHPGDVVIIDAVRTPVGTDRLLTIREGGGMANATIIERLS